MSKMDSLQVDLLQVSMEAKCWWALMELMLDEVEMEDHETGLACYTDVGTNLGIQTLIIPWWFPIMVVFFSYDADLEDLDLSQGPTHMSAVQS